MKITKNHLKQIIKEEIESDPLLLKAIKELSGEIRKLDVSIDYLAGVVTGDDPFDIEVGQRQFGRFASRKRTSAMQKENNKSIKSQLEQMIREEMEKAGEPIPPEELHDALSAAIYDLYKYVNGIRPRWIKFDEMNVAELEEMHHSLTAELEQQAQDEEAHSYKPDYDPSEYTRGLEDRYISDHDAYEAEQELMMTPEEGEEFPQTQGMGRRPLVGPARDVRRGRKISERLKEMIKDELRTIYEGNIADYPVYDYDALTDKELIARANEAGMEEILVPDEDGGLANRDEVIQQLSLADNEGRIAEEKS